MKNTIKGLAILFTLLMVNSSIGQPITEQDFAIPYGANKTVGQHITINGTPIYYEEYGTGAPLLLIHGNGGSIRDMGHQIDFFKSDYRVIIADNRGHGKSTLNTDSLTYVQIASDWEGLVDHLNLDSVSIIGWSDGGIVGLLMGINQQTKIKRLAVMGANLRPDSTAVYPFAVNWLKQMRPYIQLKISERDTSQNWKLINQQLGLLADQPSISSSELAKIVSPTLVMAGDKDIIREEHTLEIYQHIPNAQLCIFPGETHYVPATDPVLFNETVARFLSKPFKRPDSDFTK